MVAAGETSALDEGKQAWVEDETWQPLRKLCEDLLVTKDWFELYVAQNLVLDGMLYPLAYDRFDTAISQHGGSALAMLTGFPGREAFTRIAAGVYDDDPLTPAPWTERALARACGLGQPTGIGLANEANGLIPTTTRSTWPTARCCAAFPRRWTIWRNPCSVRTRWPSTCCPSRCRSM